MALLILSNKSALAESGQDSECVSPDYYARQVHILALALEQAHDASAMGFLTKPLLIAQMFVYKSVPYLIVSHNHKRDFCREC